ncbi:complement component C3 [Octopus vulgaris]|uniref:Complement component C3 n=1 Tax=Octopus vulgaris TaxID=6645 RepID=A0AA36BPZ8_OCTVU|nr:complement component C3 [Octopus vulgaris]
MKTMLLLLKCCLLLAISSVQGRRQQKVLIVTPQKFRCNEKETVLVNPFTFHTRTAFRITLEHSTHGNIIYDNTIYASKTSPRYVQITVKHSDLLNRLGSSSDTGEEEHSVVLSVTSKGFSEKKEIPVSMKSGHIFIQTSKPIYNPGQTVRIRIVTLNEDMLPTKFPVSFSIQNPSKLILYSCKFPGDSPFINASYELTSQPPIGNWTVLAEYSNGLKTRAEVKFAVQKYVLPVFEVTITVRPQFILKSTRKVVIVTNARYLYGKYVHGEVTLKCTYGSNITEGCELKRQLLHGRTTTTITLPKEPVPLGTVFKVVANVIEKDSAITETKTDESAKFVSSPYKFDLTDSQTFFKPGLPYTIQVETLYINGSKIPRLPFYIAYKALTRSKNIEYYKAKYESRNSLKEVVINTTKFWREFTIIVTSANYHLTMEDQATEEWEVASYKSESDSYLLLSLNVPENGYKVGDDITMKVVTSRKSFKTPLHFMLIGNGKILKHYTIPYRKSYWASYFSVTEDMIPIGRVIVYYMRNLEIVADSRAFAVQDACKGRELKLLTTSKAAYYHPLTNVEMEVRGDPGAYVALSAVDNAVYLLNDKNRITQKYVKDMMKLSNVGCSPGGGLNAGQVFYDSGFNIMTKGLPATPKPGRTYMLCALKKIPKEKVLKRTKRSDFCCITGSQMKGINCTESWLNFRYPNKDENCQRAFLDCCLPKATIGPIIVDNGTDHFRITNDRNNRIKTLLSEYFPESELFTQYQLNKSGVYRLNFTLPASVTSWHIQGMSVGDKVPFCVAKPIDIVTFKKVITKVSLPYVVKRLEQILVKAVVYNYKKEIITVKLAFHETKGICSHAAPGKPYEVIKKILPQSLEVSRLAIIPLWTGNFTIRVTVTQIDDNFREEIRKTLRVQYEGIKETKSISLMLDPSGTFSKHSRPRRQLSNHITIPKNEIYVSQKTQSIILNLNQPPDAIDGSANGDIVITGNLLGSTIQTTLKEPEKLLKKPYGCGEQTMIFLAPCVYVLKYLNSTNQVTPEIFENSTRFIRLGILKEQEFRKIDGSYAAFDRNSASTWLTAFVLKVFCQAAEFEYVDPMLTRTAITWLINKQKPDGSFVENNPVIHTEMMGGLSKQAMTAFVLISLMECKRIHPEIEFTRTNEIILAAKLLENQIEKITNSYDMAIIAYALSLTNSHKKYRARIKLSKMAVANLGNDYRYWTVTEIDNGFGRTPDALYHSEESYLSIEATAYALLTELHFGRIEESTPIVKWLTEQRSEAGMFKSTQDTVMALQALAKYGSMTKVPDINMLFNLTSSKAHLRKHLTVNKESSLWSQVVSDVPINDEVLIESMGTGSAQMEFNMNYYRPPSILHTCHFNISYVIKNINKSTRKLIKEGCPLCGESCQTWTGVRLNSWSIQDYSICMTIYLSYLGRTNPGMVVLDMDLLTGYDTPEELLKQLVYDKVITKYDKYGSSRLILYFNTVPFYRNLKINLLLFRSVTIYNHLMPAPIHVYAYYRKSVSCTKFYQLSTKKELVNILCDEERAVCKCTQRECITCYEDRSLLMSINMNLLEKKACIKDQIVMVVNVTQPFDPEGMARGRVVSLLAGYLQNLENREVIFQRGICDCPYLENGHTYLVMSNKYVKYNKQVNKFWLDKTGFIAEELNQYAKKTILAFKTKTRSITRHNLCKVYRK